GKMRNEPPACHHEYRSKHRLRGITNDVSNDDRIVQTWSAIVTGKPIGSSLDVFGGLRERKDSQHLVQVGPDIDAAAHDLLTSFTPSAARSFSRLCERHDL